ncbi:hypothetical protein PINS_up007763 [Pythium insidiosum]|nr:hypothetical protein PINS_up007763 [Pythium insidiosum]
MAPPRSSTSLPKRLRFTYKQRLELCEHARANPSLTLSGLAHWAMVQFKLPKEPSESVIRSTRAREDEWRRELEAAGGSSAENLRRRRHVRAPEVEEALVKWLRERPNGERPSGAEITARAEEIAEELAVPWDRRPKFSKGWLASFQDRHRLTGKQKKVRPSLSEPIPERIVLTFEQRAEICRYAAENPTLSMQKIAEWATEKFRLRKYISSGAVRTTLQRAEEWQRATTRTDKKKKHLRGKNADFEDALVAWVKRARQRHEPPTCRDITERGRQLADEMGVPESDRPKFSTGWLHSFQLRHGLLLRQVGKRKRVALNADDDDGDEDDDDDGEAPEAEEGDEDGEGDEDEDEQEDANPRARKSRSVVAHLLNEDD